jgi:hypothetical protein
MNEFIQISICVVAFAAPFATPALYAVRRHRRNRHLRLPEPYLGEFVPCETPMQRQQRERLEQWQEMVARH